VGVGVYALCSRGRRACGVAATVLAVAYFSVVAWGVIPRFNPLGIYPWCSLPGQTPKFAAEDPGPAHARVGPNATLVSDETAADAPRRVRRIHPKQSTWFRVRYCLEMGIATGALQFAGGGLWTACLPAIARNAIAGERRHLRVYTHYSCGAAVILVYATALGLARLLARQRARPALRRGLVALPVGMALLFSAQTWPVPPPLDDPWDRPGLTRASDFLRLAQRVPRDASVFSGVKAEQYLTHCRQLRCYPSLQSVDTDYAVFNANACRPRALQEELLSGASRIVDSLLFDPRGEYWLVLWRSGPNPVSELPVRLGFVQGPDSNGPLAACRPLDVQWSVEQTDASTVATSAKWSRQDVGSDAPVILAADLVWRGGGRHIPVSVQVLNTDGEAIGTQVIMFLRVPGEAAPGKSLRFNAGLRTPVLLPGETARLIVGMPPTGYACPVTPMPTQARFSVENLALTRPQRVARR